MLYRSGFATTFYELFLEVIVECLGKDFCDAISTFEFVQLEASVSNTCSKEVPKVH